MKILALNCGSSSLKFLVVEVLGGAGRCRRLARGLIQRIGGEAECSFAAGQKPPVQETAPVRDHREAVERVLSWIRSPSGAGIDRVDAAGHRVVHGGERFTAPVEIDEEVMAAIEEARDLAPLHNAPSLSGIRACRGALGA
ncbi:MAG TPA: acetate kinase, partial [Thermoanaerobaculia bacterium]